MRKKHVVLLIGMMTFPVFTSAFGMLDSGLAPLVRPELDMQKVELGRLLFHEKRLSADNSISCAHCHALDAGGVDGTVHSFGVNGAEGGINAPTVYNSGFNLAQFWDGRAATLEDQIDGPVHNPVEMASSWPEILSKLRQDSRYQETFGQLYDDGLTADNIKNAIATFERSLVTVNSPFDRYLSGDAQAISAEARRGYELFRDYGCISCHQGANVGGNMFQIFGVFGDRIHDRGNEQAVDAGRFNVTGDPSDRYKFKVPSLRVVTLTAPYFHDGSVAQLDDAIRIMGRYQLGRDIPDEDIHDLIAFLESLVGELAGGHE